MVTAAHNEVIIPYCAEQIERFISDTRGTVLVEAVSMRQVEPNAFAGELTLYNSQAHKRLFIPNLHFYYMPDGWHIDAPPAYQSVWHHLPSEGLQMLLSALDAGRHQPSTKVDFRSCSTLPFLPPDEPRAIPLESDITEFERLSHWCRSLRGLIEGKRVMEIAGGGGYASSWLSQWTEQYICADWDIVGLQVAFETFWSQRVEYRWVANPPALAKLIEQARPEVLVCLQPLSCERVRDMVHAASIAMATLPYEPCLIMPHALGDSQTFERFFARTVVEGDFIIGSCPQATAELPAGSYPHRAERWRSLQWQMRIHKTILPSDINSVFGYLRPQDAIFLYEAASLLPDGGTIVEIGSFMGLSSIIMAHAVKANRIRNARLYCVDLWDKHTEQNQTVSETDFFAYASRQLREIYDDNVHTAGVRDITTACCGDSREVAYQFENGSVDILFVDGDHTFEGCLADLESWFPKMRSTGFVIGHDFDWEPVARAAQTFTQRHSLRLQSAYDCPIFFIPMPHCIPRASRLVQPVELSVYCSV